MSDRSRTVLEVQADITDITSKIATVDKQLDQMAVQGQQSMGKVGAGFNAAGKQAASSGKLMANGSNQAMTAVTGLNWAVSDMPYFFQNTRMGIMAVSNNITPLVQNMAYLQKTTGSLKGAMKAMGSVFTGPMGVVFAITAVVAIIQALSFIIGKQKQKAEDATGANKKYKESLEQINKSVNVDALESQIDNSIKIVQATDQVIENKKEQIALEKEELQKIKDKQTYLSDAEQELNLLITDNTRTQSKAEEELLERRIKQKKDDIEIYKSENGNLDIKYSKQKNVVKEVEKELETAKELKLSQTKTQESINARLELLKQIGIESKKIQRYEEKLFEIQTARLPIEEQLSAWESKKAQYAAETTEEEKKSVDYKEKILEYDQNIEKLTIQKEKIEGEIVELKNKELSGDEKITSLRSQQAKLDQSKLEDMKEYLVLQGEIDKIQAASYKARDEAEEKYKLLKSGVDTESQKYLNNKIKNIETELLAEEMGAEKRKELETDLYNFKSDLWEKEKDHKEWLLEQERQYQEQLAGIISDGSIEGVYENMFSNIKQKVFEYWLQKLGITRAMMNMEQAIIMLGEGNIQGIRDMFHRKEMTQKAAETGASATAAGVKATESAAGIPFPGNLAAIGLVLASVFSALRKSKINGQQIVAAAEGAIINKPTLLLAGEALNRSGTEIVMPEKNFNRYMERDIIPGIMAKVNIDNSGLKTELKQVRSAIYEIGKQIPGETGKAVKRALRGKL